MDINYIIKNTSLLEYCKNSEIDIKNSNMAKCIFHKDNTPSMRIYPDTNTYYCFGCQANGDIVAFVQHHKRLSFNEACWLLINMFNLDRVKSATQQVPLWVPKPECSDTQLSESCDMSQDHKEIYKYFCDSLTLTEQGMMYLGSSRGFSSATIEKSKLLSIDNPEALLEHLTKKYTNEVLSSCGLVVSNEEYQSLFCRYPSIIIPFYNIQSEPVYFSSRAYSNKKFSKLAGIPQVPYVLSWGHQEYYVFESVFDLLSFYELTGKDNLLSLNGLTGFEKLNDYLGEQCSFSLCFDNDEAGYKTTQMVKQRSTLQLFDNEPLSVTAMIEKHKLPVNLKDYNDVLLQIRRNNDTKYVG